MSEMKRELKRLQVMLGMHSPLFSGMHALHHLHLHAVGCACNDWLCRRAARTQAGTQQGLPPC